MIQWCHDCDCFFFDEIFHASSFVVVVFRCLSFENDEMKKNILSYECNRSILKNVNDHERWKKKNAIQRYVKCNHANTQLETFSQIFTHFIEKLENSNFEMKIWNFVWQSKSISNRCKINENSLNSQNSIVDQSLNSRWSIKTRKQLHSSLNRI